MSDAVRGILETAKTLSNSEFVFPGLTKKTAHIDKTAFVRWLRKNGFDCTAHGFRSTAADYLSNEGGYPLETVKAVLSHCEDSTTAAYVRTDRLEERRAMMQAWSAYLAS